MVCRRSAANGVPQRAILLSYGIIVFMALFDFNVILGVDNFLSALACVTELAAVARLRYKLPQLERPYKVAVSDRGLVLLLAVPLGVGSFVLVNELTKSRVSLALNALALAGGLLAHRLLRRSASYRAVKLAARLELERGDYGSATPSTPMLTSIVTPEQPLLLAASELSPRKRIVFG